MYRWWAVVSLWPTVTFGTRHNSHILGNDRRERRHIVYRWKEVLGINILFI